jgi:DNA-binding winged helix-turn-helix (wHTH) protein
MPPPLSWSFGPFRLDPASGCLWREEQLIPLPPKPLAVLAYLVAHAGQVVTKEALLEAVWPEVVVTEGVLKTCLGQIRRALGEAARKPMYIATVHRRGYRFTAPVTIVEPAQAEEVSHTALTLPPRDSPQLRPQLPRPPR